ncbi:MAG: ABC transporter permease/substrate-binding protein [Blastomonas sp.]
MSTLLTGFERVPALLSEHVQLSLSALGLALLIALPTAIWAMRSRRVAQIALGLASLIQTIPALALLALFFPILLAVAAMLGDRISPLGFLPSLLALTLYALLPILRNAVTGLKGIDPALGEAADALGMTGWQKLRVVEAPLAAPMIMAGIRTAAVWTIGAATLSTTVGQPSLGDLIFAGLQTQNWSLVLAGCIAAAGLAMLVDALLGMVETGLARRQPLRIRLAGALMVMGLAAALMPGTIMRQGTGEQRETVIVGAKRFTEQFILARVIGQRLEDAGYRVEYREGMGSAVVFGALTNGDIDVYVDYSGTIWTNAMKRTDPVSRPDMIDAIGKWVATEHGARLAGALGFENTYAFAVREADAKRLNLRTLDDVVRVSPDFTFGTDVEFLERPEWQMVQNAYPLRFKAERAFEPTFMYRALASGQADIISAFSSDGRIAANRFVVLEDPAGAIPGYDAILLASPRRSGDERFLRALQPLAGSISVEMMREANYRVDRPRNKQTSIAAARWLNRQIDTARSNTPHKDIP